MNRIFFFKSKYFVTCICYGLLMGSSMSLRVSLVFLLAQVFFLSDSDKFITYSSFTVASDLTPILASYLALNFFRSQTICIFGFFLCGLGILIFSFSLFFVKIPLFFMGLSFLSIGFGIIRSNLMSINSEYLNIEFKENKKEFGSLLYFFTVLSSFLIVFVGGFFLKKKLNYIIFIISGLIFLSFSFFLYSEKKHLMFSGHLAQGVKINFIKILKTLFLIFASSLFAFSFYFFGKINFLFNLPIIFFLGFYIYMTFRGIKNKDERESIFFAISVSILIVFFLMIERQRDTSIALFVSRNMNYMHLDLSPLQINAIFSIFMLSINLIFFKIKLHSKINLSKLFYLIPFFVFLTFFILYLSCFFPDDSARVSFSPYLLSMLFMGAASVLVFARYSEVCAFSVQKIRVLISSFMVISMGFGFYLTRFVGLFMEINKENQNSFHSLKIYQNGFLKICFISLIFLTLVFCKNFSKSIKKFLENK